GFGRVGRNLAHYVSSAGQDVVVVENDPDRATAAEASAHVVRGDATSDEVLKEAGIERARVLVTALTTDADNLFVTLTARSLRAGPIRDSTGALILALRGSGGEFTTNPLPETVLEAGQILIAIGTEAQLKALAAAARP